MAKDWRWCPPASHQTALFILLLAPALLGQAPILPAQYSPAAAQPHSATFNLNGGGSAIATGATGPNIETEFASTAGIYKTVITSAPSSSTCTIAIDVWKANGVIPTVSNLISGSSPITLSSSSCAEQTTFSGYSTTAVATDDYFQLSIESSPTPNCLGLTIQIWWK